MATHDYQISIAGVALSTLVVASRFTKYTAGYYRGQNLVLPYRHGEYYVPDKYFSNADVMLEVFLPSDTIDAAAEALSEIQALLTSQSLVVVSQVDPHRGNIRARVELATEPVPSQNDFVYLFALNNPSGFWEDVTASTAASATPPVVTTGGDRPVDDMVLTFAGPGTLTHTDELGVVSEITIDAAAGAGTYVVDVGAGSVTKTGANQDEFLTVTQPWWMKFSPGAAQDLDSDVAVAVSWRNKWA